MKNILFGIVCFRERFWECESFTSLVSSFKGELNNELHIFVFDNTDLQNWDLDRPEFSGNIHVNYVHFNTNPGIAFAYNKIADFAQNNSFKWLVFMDQDSLLPINAYPIYENFSLQNSEGIAVPTVVANGKLISPSYYKYYRSSLISKPLNEGIVLDQITCINSGLMISVDDYFLSGAYSKQLRIDFCDHEFMERVSKRIDFLHILDFQINQNFSTNTNDLKKAIFRYQLFLKDLRAYRTIHHNTKLIILTVDLPHLLRLTLQYKTLDFCKERYFN